MSTAASRPGWNEMNDAARRDLDRQYLKELSLMSHPGLTEEGVQAYLDYRHERPELAITTYEEGQIRTLLQPFLDPSRVPDPVAEEEHTGKLETFGARRLHLTNAQTYVAVMVTLNFLFLIALLIYVM